MIEPHDFLRPSGPPSGWWLVTEMKSFKHGVQGAVNYHARRLCGGVINSRLTVRYIYRRRCTTVQRYTMAGLWPLTLYRQQRGLIIHLL